ncbi:MAG TPA: thiamine diphosphokinase [Bellilinea sp.]|nr:thiamine diphosphokinase [Bellilinea sp.]
MTKRAFVFVNGLLTDADGIRRQILPEDTLVAVDGGLRHLDTLGLTPNLLIGDLDSVDPQRLADLQAAGIAIERYPREKDESDLELALTKLAQAGYDTIRVVAALGGRLDQTLANLYLLELPAVEDLDIRLDDGREEIIIIRESLTIQGQPGDTFSLLAMDGCTRGIRTEGLQYPLKDETLCPNRTRGISNVMLGQKAQVKISSGRLLCIHTRQL